jgi:cyanophycin synthetase
LIQLGQIAARVFDRIIIKEDDDKRGRESGAVAELIAKGVAQIKPDFPQETILSETDALNQALATVEPGGLVVIFPESVSRAIELIQQRRAGE